MGRREVQDPRDVDAVDDERRVSASGGDFTRRGDHQAGVGDRGLRASTADDAESVHAYSWDRIPVAVQHSDAVLTTGTSPDTLLDSGRRWGPPSTAVLATAN